MKHFAARNSNPVSGNSDSSSMGCSKRGYGDLQIESVLSPIFTRARRLGNFPRTSILDYGCGNGALLRALRTFAPQILSKITYVGIDNEGIALAAAKKAAHEVDAAAPRGAPLTSTLTACHIGTFHELRDDYLRAHSFDAIHVVNVLHHLEPSHDLSVFLTNTFALSKVRGYIVFEDFFFGDYPRDLDWSFYSDCNPQGIYWGPAELSAIFRPVTRELGSYRYFRREKSSARDGPIPGRSRCWFGYMYFLRNYGTDLVGWEFDRGIHYAARRMLGKAKGRGRRDHVLYGEWAVRLRRVVRSMEHSTYVPWPQQRTGSMASKQLRWLYDAEDPFGRYWKRTLGPYRRSRSH